MEAEVGICSECGNHDNVVAVAADAGTGYICKYCADDVVTTIDEFEGETRESVQRTPGGQSE